MVSEDGTIVNEYEYDEWGNILKEKEDIKNDITYSGEYYDSESGLYYLRARYYDPTIGRFISRDTYEGSVTNPLSLNLYTYCHNNPVNSIDPSGHVTTEEDRQFKKDYFENLDLPKTIKYYSDQINEEYKKNRKKQPKKV